MTNNLHALIFLPIKNLCHSLSSGRTELAGSLRLVNVNVDASSPLVLYLPEKQTYGMDHNNTLRMINSLDLVARYALIISFLALKKPKLLDLASCLH